MHKIVANVVVLVLIAPFYAFWEWLNEDTTSPRARGMKNMPARIRAINRRAQYRLNNSKGNPSGEAREIG